MSTNQNNHYLYKLSQEILATVSVVLFIVSCFFFSGCNSESQVFRADISTGQKSPLVQEYHFGLLHPDDEVSHIFDISNTTNQPWHIKKIQTNCACTVPTISAEVIEPQKTEHIEIQYHAGKFNGKDKRSVYVLIDNGTVLQFTVLADVRELLSITIKEVLLQGPWDDFRNEQYIDVRNYSDVDWDDLKLNHEAKWFSATAHLLDLPKDVEPGLRQIWKVVVVPEIQDVLPGWHQSVLSISPDTEPELVYTLPVRLSIESKVKISPDQLFFGFVTSDVLVSKTLTFTFRDDVIPNNEQEIQLTHNLGEMLATEWQQMKGNIWMLKVTLLPKDRSDNEIIEGILTIDFDSADLESRELNISAMVRSRDSQLISQG